jgi:hypothetical protein
VTHVSHVDRDNLACDEPIFRVHAVPSFPARRWVPLLDHAISSFGDGMGVATNRNELHAYVRGLM